jgi:hypothetical protein
MYAQARYVPTGEYSMEYGLDVLVHIYDWGLKAEKLKKRTNKKNDCGESSKVATGCCS